jgi:hypothetical protein
MALEIIVWGLILLPVLIVGGIAYVAFEPILGPVPLILVAIVFALTIGISSTIFIILILIGLAAILGGIVS